MLKKFSVKVKRMKVWIILILIFLILIVPLIIFPTNPTHHLFLKYISTILTWPFVILILGITLLLKFKDPISELIKEIHLRYTTPRGNVFDLFPIQSEIGKFNEDNIKDKLENTDESLKLELAIEMAGFERMIRYTYRSQFRLLKHLKGAPVQVEVACNYYAEYLQSGGNKNCNLSQYLGWLKISNFIKYNKYTLSLTKRGSRFIDYCNVRGYSENEFIPL